MEDLIRRIKKHEGYSRRPYYDTEGHLTIGYGFKVEDLILDIETSDSILHAKVRDLIIKLEYADFYDGQPDAIKNVLVEMAYQLGYRGLLKFENMRGALIARDYNRAADEMLNSRWHEQTPRRCEELADIVRSHEQKEEQ